MPTGPWMPDVCHQKSGPPCETPLDTHTSGRTLRQSGSGCNTVSQIIPQEQVCSGFCNKMARGIPNSRSDGPNHSDGFPVASFCLRGSLDNPSALACANVGLNSMLYWYVCSRWTSQIPWVATGILMHLEIEFSGLLGTGHNDWSQNVVAPLGCIVKVCGSGAGVAHASVSTRQCSR